MSARSARFEIVRTDAGWHARYIAPNGQKVWTTEVYTRRRACLAAIRLLPGVSNATGHLASFREYDPNRLRNYGFIEIRDIDERESPR